MSEKYPSSRSDIQTVLQILFSIVLGLKLGAIAIYLLVARPKILQWGATASEQQDALPGDDVVEKPMHMWTRAVDIDAPPVAVWPWLVQMGQGRGGLYSYDWLENLADCDIHSVDEIIPDLQNLAVGDEIRLVKPDYPVDLALTVAQIEPQAALVLRAKGDRASAIAAGFPFISWAFILRPTVEGGTRLIVRTRAVYAENFGSMLANRYALEPVQFIMERKMMLGIKERAEGQLGADAHRPQPDRITEPV